jgi:hypothetical protein
MFFKNPKVTGCQRCQKFSKHPFGTFGTPLVSVSGKTHALHAHTPRLRTDLHDFLLYTLRISERQ